MMGRRFLASATGFHALTEGVHEIDDLAVSWLFRPLDLLAFLLLADDVFQCVFVLVFKLPGLELAFFWC